MASGDVMAFIVLCALIADVQDKLHIDKATRFIRVDDSFRRFHMPLPLSRISLATELDYYAHRLPESVPHFPQEEIILRKLAWQWLDYYAHRLPESVPHFPQEEIILRKLAWQWHLKDGKRLYTVYCGKGERSNVVAWSKPEQHFNIEMINKMSLTERIQAQLKYGPR
jgi:hypothetical protein